MSEHDGSESHESAIAKFEMHLRRRKDGTYFIDPEDVRNIGIDDPILLADFMRSLNHTNELIRRGEIKPGDIKLLTV